MSGRPPDSPQGTRRMSFVPSGSACSTFSAVRLFVAGVVFAVIAASVPGSVFAQRPLIPFDDPDRIQFAPATFVPPDPGAYAVDLGEGLTAYVAADRDTATVELTALIGASRLDNPRGKEGLAEGVAYAISGAGPAGLSPGAMRDRLYAMDARLSATVDNEHTRVSLSLLAEDLNDGLDLFVALLRAPRLDDSTTEAYRARGVVRGWDPDDPRTRPEFEFPAFVYGDHPAGRRPTVETLHAIGAGDLAAFHRRFYVPNNIVLAISGGFDRATVAAELKKRLFATPWSRAAVTHDPVPAVPKVTPRTLHVFDVDRRQGWMVVGHLGRQGRQPDQAALEVANYILGGGGAAWKRVHPERPPATPEGHFKARLFNESRSVRGLTNDTSSYVPAGFRVPALAYAVTLGRPESIAYLLKIVDTEWRRIGEEVTDLEIEIAKGALTEGAFQMRYAGGHHTALSLAEEKFFDGGYDWSRGYVAAIRAVTKPQVIAAAKKYFRAEDLLGVLVGPLQRIQASEHPLYKAKLSDFGAIVVHPW